MRAIGEWEVRGDALAQTRFHFRTGMTSWRRGWLCPEAVVSCLDVGASS
jgi:hypothetical protein